MQSPTQMIQQHEDYFFQAVYPSAGTGGHSEAVSWMISTSLQTDIAAEVSLSSNDNTERKGKKTLLFVGLIRRWRLGDAWMLHKMRPFSVSVIFYEWKLNTCGYFFKEKKQNRYPVRSSSRLVVCRCYYRLRRALSLRSTWSSVDYCPLQPLYMFLIQAFWSLSFVSMMKQTGFIPGALIHAV